MGETTFLFQFVAPPPVQPRPQLPLAVKGGLANQIDWNLTIIAAFSFMLHFGLIGAMYSDWMDPIVNDDVNVQGLIDLASKVPPAPIEEKPAETAKSDDKKSDGANPPRQRSRRVQPDPRHRRPRTLRPPSSPKLQKRSRLAFLRLSTGARPFKARSREATSRRST